MAFDLKKDWPVAAAGVAAVVGVVLVSKGGGTISGNKPVIIGGPDPSAAANYQAALQAQTAISQSRQQAYVSLASTFVQGAVQHEQIVAAAAATELQGRVALVHEQNQLEAARINANAQLAAVRGQQQVQSQSNLFGFILSALPSIFSIFSVEATELAAKRRKIRSRPMATAYQGVFAHAA